MSAATSDWQIVGAKEKQRKQLQQQRKKASQQEQAGVPGFSGPEATAFAALDAWKRDDTKQPAKPQISNGVAHARLLNGFGHTTDDTASDTSQSRQEAPRKPKKPKAPKVKKATPAAAGQNLKLAALKQVLQSAQERYASDEQVQLNLLADHLVGAFGESELPFNKLLSDQPLQKVTEKPLDAVPADVAAELRSFIVAKDAQSVADFVWRLLSAAFEGIPEAAGSSKSPPKANVGLLVALAAALRAKPAALLLCSEQLASGGRRFSSTGRLPLLLWLLNQVARGSEAAAVAVWIRVLLPQILGADAAAAAAVAAATSSSSSKGKGKPTNGQAAATSAPANGKAAQQAASASSHQEVQPLPPASAHRALEYLDSLLRTQDVKARMSSGIAIRDGLPPAPIVPPAAVALLQTLLLNDAPAPLRDDVLERVKHHQAIIRTLAFSGAEAGGFNATELLALALDNAAAAGSSLPTEPLTRDAAELVVEALLADDAAFGMWHSRHKAQLRGSSRVLTALDAGHPGLTMGLLADAGKRTTLLALLPDLRQRHRFHLQNGKGWQGAAARAADAAAVSLAAKLRRDSGRSALRSAGLTIAGGIGISIAVSVLTGDSVWQHPLLQLAAAAAEATGAAALAQQAQVQLEPYWQQAASLAAPYLQPISEAVSPLLRQVSNGAGQAARHAASVLRNATAQWLPAQ